MANTVIRCAAAYVHVSPMDTGSRQASGPAGSADAPAQVSFEDGAICFRCIADVDEWTVPVLEPEAWRVRGGQDLMQCQVVYTSISRNGTLNGPILCLLLFFLH